MAECCTVGYEMDGIKFEFNDVITQFSVILFYSSRIFKKVIIGFLIFDHRSPN